MLTGLVSDYLFEQRIRQDSLSVEKLATTLAPFFSSADTDALQESIVSEGGDMGGRLLLTDAEGKVQLDSYAALLGVRLELPQVVAALTQSTGSAYGIHPLTDATGSADEEPGSYVSVCAAPMVRGSKTIGAVVLGKYAAACTVLLCTVGASGIYALIVAIYGTLYLPETLVGYLGFVLQGCAFLALDLFVSCFARSQMTAVVLGVGANLLVWFSDVVAQAVTVDAVSNALSFISLYQRFAPFAQGQLRAANVLYDLVFVGSMLFLSVRVLDARRWSEA